MKRIVIAGLSVLVVSLSAVTAKAETETTATHTRQISPAQLVDSAYRGQIEGISRISSIC